MMLLNVKEKKKERQTQKIVAWKETVQSLLGVASLNLHKTRIFP